jgi:periplasmic protein CpxP/Spy
MRSGIVIATVVSLTAGAAFAQQETQPSEQASPSAQQEAPPSELGAAQHPPIHSETAPVTTERSGASAALSEEQAKAKIESEGYMEVSDLKQDDKGMWTAKAMRDGKAVQISLNAEGRISLIN